VQKGFHITIPLRIYFTRQELKTRTCSIPRYKAHGSRGYVEQKQKQKTLRRGSFPSWFKENIS
jgi:hypothetical protein